MPADSANQQSTEKLNRPLPKVSARMGAMIIDVASARGVDPGALMAESGFQSAWLDDPDAHMPLSVETRLWDGAARRTGDPYFGLHAAAAIRPGTFQVLDYAVRTAPDLRTALDRLARYNRLVHDVARFEIHPQGSAVRIEHRFEGTEARPCRQAAEFTLASLVVVASQISAEPVRALAVEFSHASLGETADYQSIFGVAPRFDAPTSCLLLSADVLRRPVPAADPALSHIVIAHAESRLAALEPPQQTIRMQVRRVLARGVVNGVATLEQVASALCMSERSLQRRLRGEGACFSDLLDEVRRELALQYIANERMALGEVAYVLGFSEPSAFHRAFKRWTGMTPATARKRPN